MRIASAEHCPFMVKKTSFRFQDSVAENIVSAPTTHPLKDRYEK
jgi:hypothetical protein